MRATVRSSSSLLGIEANTTCWKLNHRCYSSATAPQSSNEASLDTPKKASITPRIRYLHKDYRRTSIDEPHNKFEIEYNKAREALLSKQSVTSAKGTSNDELYSNDPDLVPRIFLVAQGYCLGKAYKRQVAGDDEKLYGGEDAYFIQDNNPMTSHHNPFGADPKDGVQSIGVSDGVGGWSHAGVDASLMSRQLMQNCFLYSLFNGKTFSHPRQLIERAYMDVIEKKQVTAGSATCCVLTLNESNSLLLSANIGDSGFLILRKPEGSDKYQLFYKSTPQQHYHNAPYQLAVVPEYFHGKFQDSPNDAICDAIKVTNGDLIILATDGLFDNLYDDKIIELVNQNQDKSEFEIAKLLVLTARSIGFGYEPVKSTPFQDQSEKHGIFYLGGKPDDVTAVVARVVCTDK